MIKIDQQKVDELNAIINPSPIKQFNETLNQWDNQKQWYQCSFYASAQNLSYNCWIILTENDLNIIAENQSKLWLFDYKAGARWLDSTNAILNYLKTKWIKLPRLLQIVDDNQIKDLIWKGYMIMTWISVNNNFRQDILDWKIDTVNYSTMIWTQLKHYLNIINDWKVKLIDNYWNNWKRPNEYECDLDKLLTSITQHTKFIFIY